MNIYSPIVITEEIERRFKPTRLAVKELNGIKYLCKTIKKNINKYPGSGIHWGKIVKKYGKENIKTLWVSDWFYCPHHLQEFALMYSEYNQIVQSDEWANLIPENGINGAPPGHKPYWNPTDVDLIEHGKKSKELWEDPIFRSKVIKSQQDSWTDDRRTEQAERLSGQKRPEHSDTMKKLWNDSEKRKMASEFFSEMKRTKVHSKNISIALSGVPKSEEHKRKLRVPKLRCCRLSDRKEISVNALNRR